MRAEETWFCSWCLLQHFNPDMKYFLFSVSFMRAEETPIFITNTHTYSKKQLLICSASSIKLLHWKRKVLSFRLHETGLRDINFFKKEAFVFAHTAERRQ